MNNPIYARKDLHVILIGDSDMEQWPLHMIPTFSDTLKPDEVVRSNIHNHGRGGAILQDVVKMTRAFFQQEEYFQIQRNPLIFIACAGENDIGSGIRLESSVNSMEDLINLILSRPISDQSTKIQEKRSKDQYESETILFFLGPKIEPWLISDVTTRKQYIKLSKQMDKRIKNINLLRKGKNDDHYENVKFVDCLTLFCGETKDVPGALYGGRATADDKYFKDDGLHLNDDGYMLWKELLEESSLFHSRSV